METKLPTKTEPNSTGMLSTSFNSLRREIDRLFDDFDGWSWRPSRRSHLDQFRCSERSIYVPAVDIAEKKDTFEITVEVPGMEKKNIEVKLSNDALLIKGEKKSEREENNKDYYLSERSYGIFDRYFPLPTGVDAEKISASFKNGILTVIIPKSVDAQKSEMKIPIKGE
jgi:HSP20 family protein